MNACKVWTILLIIVSIFISWNTVAFSSEQYFYGAGSYEKNPKQQKEVAEEYALYYALREASEQASVYVIAQSDIRNNSLNSDDIYLATASVMKVVEKKITWLDEKNVTVNITATIEEDASVLELLARNSELIAKQRKLYAEFSEIIKQNQILKEQLSAASDNDTEIEQKILDNGVYFITNIYFNRALNAVAQKRYDEALLAVDTAISMDETYANAYALKAEIFMEMEQYEEALKQFTIAEQKDPSLFEIYTNRGLIFEKLNKTNDAMTSFDLALEKNPNDVMALSHKGAILFQLGKLNDAIAFLTRALNIIPTDSFALSTRAFCYIYKGNHNAALEDINHLICIDPNSPLGYAMRGLFLAFLHYNDAAKDNLDKAEQLHPDAKLQQVILSARQMIQEK